MTQVWRIRQSQSPIFWNAPPVVPAPDLPKVANARGIGQNRQMKTRLFTIFSFFGFLLSAAASSNDQTVYNVRSLGAVGDGTNLDSPAINRAIQVASQAGGGTVFIPAGTYLCGSIRLTNNIHLYLDAGAVILGAPQAMNVYDPTEPWHGQAYQDGGHTYFHNSLIWGENLTNVSITGPGTINGGGLVRDDELLDEMCGFSKWSPTNRTPQVETNFPPSRLGNKAIALKLCRNVLLRDITIFHGGHFAVLVTGCDNLMVDNVTMDTDRDGIDIDCCRNGTVSNCRINSPRDDGLCLKSTFALGRNVITENVTIANCQVSGFQEGTLLDGSMKPTTNGMGRIKFGTEANGGFRNVTIANCTFRGCHGLALEEVDGGIMENISINNLTMMDVVNSPIYLTTGERNRGPGVTGPSRMRNIFISSVIATGVEPTSGIQITGIPGHPIEGVRLENIRLEFKGGGTRTQAARMPPELGASYPEPDRFGTMPAYGLFARHVRDLELANVSMSLERLDLRPPMICLDVDGLEIDNFKALALRGVPAAKFVAVKNAVIRNSPILDGVTSE
jgi:Pectate lyase superfamily protein/Right handed beta helix region